MTDADIRKLLERPVPAEYVPLITGMKFFIEPEISCSRFFAEACFTDEGKMTELGTFLAKRMTGGIFLDIPCGLNSVREEGKDADLVPMAETLTFADVWEVDLTADVIRDRLPSAIDVMQGGAGYALSKNIGEIAVRPQNGITVATMQDDLLGFVSKLDVKHPLLTLYIAALQPDAEACKNTEWVWNIAVPYLSALYAEIDRVLGPKDQLILNSAAMLAEGIDLEQFPEADPDIALLHLGFTVLRRDAYGKVKMYGRE